MIAENWRVTVPLFNLDCNQILIQISINILILGGKNATIAKGKVSCRDSPWNEKSEFKNEGLNREPRLLINTTVY